MFRTDRLRMQKDQSAREKKAKEIHTKSMKEKEEAAENIRDMITELQKSPLDKEAKIGEDLAKAWSKYHMGHIVETMAGMTTGLMGSVLGGIGGMDKMFADRNLECPICKEGLVADGFMIPDPAPDPKEAEHREEFGMDPPKKFEDRKNHFVCLKCQKKFNAKFTEIKWDLAGKLGL